jgi:hypothetical protein
MNNKRFDWFRVLHNKDLTSLIDKLTNHVLSTYSIGSQGVNADARESKIRHTSSVVISALYSAYFTRSQNELWVSYPQSPRSYSTTDNKSNEIKHSHRIALKVYESLHSLGWIITKPAIVKKNYTLAYPSPSLVKEFNRIGFIWMPQELIPEDSLVELKDVKRNKKTGKAIRNKKGKTTKFKIPVPSTAEVIQYRSNLYKINQQLVRHCISIDLTNINLEAMEVELAEKSEDLKKSFIDFTSVQLTRIFARGSLEKGGRFYRGWWQGIPERHRPHIRIDGNKVTEVDFSGVAPRIIYGQAGVSIPINVDPYNVGLDAWEGKKDHRRPLVKEFLNAMINDEDGVYRLGSDDAKILGLNHKQLLKQIELTHEPIFDSLRSGAGLHAQFIESIIAEKVMLDLLEQDVVVLPIHDSFIIRLGFANDLRESMQRHFKEVTGLDVGLDTDIVKSDSSFGMTADEVTASSQPVGANIYSFAEAGAEFLEKDYSFERDFRRGWTMHQNKHH